MGVLHFGTVSLDVNLEDDLVVLIERIGGITERD